MPAGGSKVNAVRRLGTRPTGVTPASPAMTSAQAPAALTTTGAVKLPAVVSAVHRPSARARRVTSAPVTSVPPRALEAAQIAGQHGADIDVEDVGLPDGGGNRLALERFAQHDRLGRVDHACRRRGARLYR